MADTETLAGWVELEGCFNFRDLGSYRTATGRRLRGGQVFRADGLQHLTEADLDRLCDEIGLATVIDLRSSDEVAEDGRGGIECRASIHHVPLFERTRSQLPPGQEAALREALLANMGDLYFFMLQAAREPIARVVRIIAEGDAPVVFHCAAGKDRTGVISALLLSLLDVPEETIVADYSFSRRSIDRINARLAASGTYRRLMEGLPRDAHDADPAAMRGFLARVRSEHGSLADWAAGAGIGAALRERLRARLLA